MAARQSGCAASSAERLGMLASISGARSISAPLSSRVCSCARERFALKSTSAGMLPLRHGGNQIRVLRFIRNGVRVHGNAGQRLHAREKQAALPVALDGFGFKPGERCRATAPASRDRARDRERVFFKKLCIVRLRESIYRDYTILWLWRKGDAADGQGGLFARRPP